MRMDAEPIWSSLELNVKTDGFFNKVLLFTDKISLVQLSKPREKSPLSHLALSLRCALESSLEMISYLRIWSARN